jgi:hypothetical protein
MFVPGWMRFRRNCHRFGQALDFVCQVLSRLRRFGWQTGATPSEAATFQAWNSNSQMSHPALPPDAIARSAIVSVPSRAFHLEIVGMHSRPIHVQNSRSCAFKGSGRHFVLLKSGKWNDCQIRRLPMPSSYQQLNLQTRASMRCSSNWMCFVANHLWL